MKIDKELQKGSTAMLILSQLAKSDMYGYQLTKELASESQNLFLLKEGTLYPLLHGLENKGCIESYWVESETARKRKYYRITETGKKKLAAQKEEWQAYTKAVNRVIGGASHA